MPLSRTWPRHYRVFEWTMASALVAVGAHLLIFPDALSSPSRLTSILMLVTAQQIAIFCLVFGIIRIAALIASERILPWCARIRGTCCIAGAAVWSQLAVALAHSPGPPSPSFTIYAVLAIAELLSVLRARRDANG